MSHSAENDAPRTVLCEGHMDGPRHRDCPWIHPHEPHRLRVIPPEVGQASR